MSIKMRLPVNRALPSLAGAVGALCTALPALAQTVPDCSTFNNRVFVAGSTAVKPFLAVVAKILVAATPSIKVIYQGAGSCVGVGFMTSAPAGAIKGTGTIWDASGVEGTCNLTIGPGDPVDIGVSDVYATSCALTVVDGVHDFSGPVQAMTFSVPVTSNQHSISVEAAYMVFGFGADAPAHTISPWNDVTAIQVRNQDSGTQQMISAALAQVGSGFTAAKVKGASNASAAAVVSSLVASATGGNAEKAIGIIATDQVDSNRSSVRALAFKFKDQDCGYTPDSTENAFDKQNVRDGHYAIWGGIHMLTPVDSTNKSPNPNIQAIIDLLHNAPTADLIAAEAQKGVTPDCAMRVSRTSEVGPMASYMPEHSCECAFLKAATGSTTCKACTAATGTASPSECTEPGKTICNYGYCEVQ